MTLSSFILFYFIFFGNSGIWAATFPTIPCKGSSAPTKEMLNPLWSELEIVMAGTSAEVPLPPDREARFDVELFMESNEILLLYEREGGR